MKADKVSHFDLRHHRPPQTMQTGGFTQRERKRETDEALASTGSLSRLAVACSIPNLSFTSLSCLSSSRFGRADAICVIDF